MSLESCEFRAGQLALDLMVFGKPISNEELIERVDGITREDVQTIGRAFVRSRIWFRRSLGREVRQLRWPMLPSVPVRCYCRVTGRHARRAHVLFRQQPYVEGDGVFLREPQMADYKAWAALRAQSRAFLEPWEPRWARDE